MSSDLEWVKELERLALATDSLVHAQDKQSMLDMDRVVQAAAVPESVRKDALAAAKGKEMIVGKDIKITIGSQDQPAGQRPAQPVQQPKTRSGWLRKAATIGALAAGVAGAGGVGGYALNKMLSSTQQDQQQQTDRVPEEQGQIQWGRIQVEVVPSGGAENAKR